VTDLSVDLASIDIDDSSTVRDFDTRTQSIPTTLSDRPELVSNTTASYSGNSRRLRNGSDFNPTYYHAPLYFIAQIQHQQERAIGILVNYAAFPEHPVYMGIPLGSCPSPPMMTELWKVERSKQTEMASRAFTRYQFMSGDHARGEHAFISDTGGVPWMANMLINVQALARLQGLELVQRAHVEVLDGEVSKIHRITEGRRHMEVKAPGCIEEIRLSNLQYAGTGDFHAIQRLDPVKLQAVRLPPNCWVGPKFVLPDIRYYEDKAPFLPLEHEKYHIFRSKEGDYYPVKVVE